MYVCVCANVGCLTRDTSTVTQTHAFPSHFPLSPSPSALTSTRSPVNRISRRTRAALRQEIEIRCCCCHCVAVAVKPRHAPAEATAATAARLQDECEARARRVLSAQRRARGHGTGGVLGGDEISGVCGVIAWDGAVMEHHSTGSGLQLILARAHVASIAKEVARAAGVKCRSALKRACNERERERVCVCVCVCVCTQPALQIPHWACTRPGLHVVSLRCVGAASTTVAYGHSLTASHVSCRRRCFDWGEGETY